MHDIGSGVVFQVQASVGRVRVVFLMKFVNDFLRFLDPFINNQNIQNAVADTAANAQAAALVSLNSIYRFVYFLPFISILNFHQLSIVIYITLTLDTRICKYRVRLFLFQERLSIYVVFLFDVVNL